MPRDRVDPVTDDQGREHHPAFGMCRIGRIQASPGEVLFQSDILHREYIELTITTATRRRDLKHDWVHPGKVIAQLSMSMAQFASLIASGGTEGVPVTISFREGMGLVPGLNPAPRLAQTAAEVLGAAEEAYKHIQEALAAYEQGLAGKAGAAERRELMRNLRAAVNNAVPNVKYATDRLTEHAEKVVERSRADVEAMVRAAQQRGEQVQVDNPVLLALESGEGNEAGSSVDS